MSLKIAAYKNHLKSCAEPFLVRSNNSELVEFDQLVDRMAKGRTTLTKADLLGAMQLYKEELQALLSDGRSVKTPTGIFYLSASGSFSSFDEAFSPRDLGKNHDVRLHHRADRALEEGLLASLKIVREDHDDAPGPLLRSVTGANGEEGDPLRPSGFLVLRGSRLRLDARDPRQGLFFLDQEGIEHRCPYYPRNYPSELLAAMPAPFAAGSYSLILRTSPTGKDLREGRLEGILVEGV